MLLGVNLVLLQTNMAIRPEPCRAQVLCHNVKEGVLTLPTLHPFADLTSPLSMANSGAGGVRLTCQTVQGRRGMLLLCLTVNPTRTEPSIITSYPSKKHWDDNSSPSLLPVWALK